jgi:Mrp family chromosome partitioning ATPase
LLLIPRQVCPDNVILCELADNHIISGTSDEHLSLLEHLAPVHDRLSAVVVTTPQAVALADAVKGVSFTRAVNLPVLGVIENMSGYACPCCGEASTH